MEYLWHLIKITTLLEWVIFATAILFAFILVIVGIVLFFRASRRVTIAIFMACTLLPLVLCFATIGVRYFHNQRRYSSNEYATSGPVYEEYLKKDRADYIVAGLIGIVLTVPSFLVGAAGLITKRRL
jgi:hypothetical protein